jgi:hypothetical protein
MRRFTQSKMNSVKAVRREARVIVEGADRHALWSQNSEKSGGGLTKHPVECNRRGHEQRR